MTDEQWMPVSLFCPHCGTVNTGYRNTEEKIRYECKHCGTVFVRSKRGRRHEAIDIYLQQEEIQENRKREDKRYGIYGQR